MHKPQSQRDAQVQRVILIEGTANVLVLSLKAIVGISTGSLAVLGDAIHSLTDVANNVAAWLVIRLSSKPADSDHPYGHRKFETLAVFGLASLLAVLAFELALHAIQRDDPEVSQDKIGLLLMLLVLGINIALAAWQRRWAKRLDSDILLADASHTFADVMTTVVVILGWQLSAAGYVWLDTVCAVAVAGLVFYLAFSLFQRVVPVLVDEVSVEADAVARAVRSVPGVRKIRRIRSRWIGSDRAVDLVICVDPTLSTGASHAIADSIEAIIEHEFHVADITVHIEPDEESLSSELRPNADH
ncbi:MAG: cation diffusion facilitator family transporter [Pseudomonadales bacterium]